MSCCLQLRNAGHRTGHGADTGETNAAQQPPPRGRSRVLAYRMTAFNCVSSSNRLDAKRTSPSSAAPILQAQRMTRSLLQEPLAAVGNFKIHARRTAPTKSVAVTQGRLPIARNLEAPERE